MRAGEERTDRGEGGRGKGGERDRGAGARGNTCFGISVSVGSVGSA